MLQRRRAVGVGIILLFSHICECMYQPVGVKRAREKQSQTVELKQKISAFLENLFPIVLIDTIIIPYAFPPVEMYRRKVNCSNHHVPRVAQLWPLSSSSFVRVSHENPLVEIVNVDIQRTASLPISVVSHLTLMLRRGMRGVGEDVLVSTDYTQKGLVLWYLNGNKPAYTMDKEHEGIITCLAALSNGKILSGSANGIIKVWQPFQQKALETLQNDSGSVTHLAAIASHAFVSSFSGGDVTIWDLKEDGGFFQARQIFPLKRNKKCIPPIKDEIVVNKRFLVLLHYGGYLQVADTLNQKPQFEAFNNDMTVHLPETIVPHDKLNGFFSISLQKCMYYHDLERGKSFPVVQAHHFKEEESGESDDGNSWNSELHLAKLSGGPVVVDARTEWGTVRCPRIIREPLWRSEK